MKARRSSVVAAAAAASLVLLYGCYQAGLRPDYRPALIEPLPVPIESVTFAQFVATVQQLHLGECRDRRRRSTSTSTPHQPTEIQVCAYQGAQYVGGAHTSYNGDIVTQLLRTGTDPDARWQLERSPIEYYMVVSQRYDAQGQGVLRYHMVKLDRATSQITIGSAYVWAKCPNHTHAPPAVARASFRDCANGPPDHNDQPKNRASGNSTTSPILAALWPVATAFAAPAQGLDSPEWVDCENGCCTGGAKVLAAIQ